MKVLFISDNKLPDFQNDMIFHGGRSVLKENFIDCNKLWYMYSKDKKLYWTTRIPQNGKSYGRGFTLYGHFNDDFIDRRNIEERIKRKEFTKIIYGSFTRCLDYIDIVVKHYSKEEIILVDGEDDQIIRKDLLGIGTYYKRELVETPTHLLKPISFAIPKSHIVESVPEKKLQYATIIPGDLSTYIYDEESEYYQGYRDAYLGVTTKKGGWDCLRHYEVIMNGCMPYFPNLEKCPTHTMHTFPKELVIKYNREETINNLTYPEYKQDVENLLEYCRKHLTTEHLFNYIING